MLDTLTVITYLLGHDPVYSDHLHLKALFSEKQTITQCAQAIASPRLQWQGVPPGADSLAVVMHDEKNYYWVAYNLPVGTKGLPLGANKIMNVHDEGVNSFGEKSYHSPWSCAHNAQAVMVELYALDKRFSARTTMSGDVLIAKLKNHVMARAIVQVQQPESAVAAKA